MNIHLVPRNGDKPMVSLLNVIYHNHNDDNALAVTGNSTEYYTNTYTQQQGTSQVLPAKHCSYMYNTHIYSHLYIYIQDIYNIGLALVPPQVSTNSCSCIGDLPLTLCSIYALYIPLLQQLACTDRMQACRGRAPSQVMAYHCFPQVTCTAYPPTGLSLLSSCSDHPDGALFPDPFCQCL